MYNIIIVPVSYTHLHPVDIGSAESVLHISLVIGDDPILNQMMAFCQSSADCHHHADGKVSYGILISSRHIQNRDAKLCSGSNVHVGMGASSDRGNDL